MIEPFKGEGIKDRKNRISFRKIMETGVLLEKNFSDRWCRALRSGDYIQGQDSLVQKDSAGDLYCCLGIAGELCNFSTDEMNDKCDFRTQFDNDLFNLPDALTVKNGAMQNLLALMNDAGQTFDQLADFIEEHLTEKI